MQRLTTDKSYFEKAVEQGIIKPEGNVKWHVRGMGIVQAKHRLQKKRGETQARFIDVEIIIENYFPQANQPRSFNV